MRHTLQRRGMTLIEIVLALALTTLIAGLIGGIMRWYVLNQTRADNTFDELRMARAVLTMISDDFRCTLRNEPFDVGPLMTLLQSSSGGGGGGSSGGGGAFSGGSGSGGGASTGGGGAGGQGGGGGNGGGGNGGGGTGGQGGTGGGGGATGGGANGGGGGGAAGGGGSGASSGSMSGGSSSALSSLASGGSGSGGGSSGASSSSGTDGSTSTTSTLPPGIYASTTMLQIDVSRVPRVDEAILQPPNVMSGTLNDLPTDIKTVSYYVQGNSINGVQDSLATLSTDVMNSSTSSVSNGGLVRQIIARDVLQKAYTDGRSTLISRTGSLVSRDVVGLQVQFYDGVKWYTTWDSSSQGLPRVVKILVAMQNPSTPLEKRMLPPLNLNSMSGVSLLQSGITIYTTVVTIPGSALASNPASSDSAASAMGTQ